MTRNSKTPPISAPRLHCYISNCLKNFKLLVLIWLFWSNCRHRYSRNLCFVFFLAWRIFIKMYAQLYNLLENMKFLNNRLNISEKLSLFIFHQVVVKEQLFKCNANWSEYLTFLCFFLTPTQKKFQIDCSKNLILPTNLYHAMKCSFKFHIGMLTSGNSIPWSCLCETTLMYTLNLILFYSRHVCSKISMSDTKVYEYLQR